MEIPKNATQKWFEERVKDGTFDAVKWVRWQRSEDQELYERDPEAFWKKLKDSEREDIKEYGSGIMSSLKGGARKAT